MPSELVTVVTTAIGVSIFAGILSGVCYIVVHGFTPIKSHKRTLQWHCLVCERYLPFQFEEDTRIVICIECEQRVCKVRCSEPDYVRKGWKCHKCVQRPSKLKNILDILLSRYKKIAFLNHMDPSLINEMDENNEPVPKQNKDYVRDFVEKLVSSILGGNVDDASIFRIYNDKQYDVLFERYHQDLSIAITNLSSALHMSINNAPVIEQTPCTAHTNLKQLIQRILREVLCLPQLRDEVNYYPPTEESERTYEELLATAIINTAISEKQPNLPSSSTASVSSRKSTTSRNRSRKEYFFGDETLDDKWKHTDLEITSNSSADSSLGSTKYVDLVSLTIQQQIEEASPTDLEVDEEDDLYYFRSNSSLSQNESNWYLQKPQFNGKASPVPVPMLVPNPVAEAKVLIGDRDIDETSDLSDIISDYEESSCSESEVPIFAANSTLIIEQKNEFTRKMISDEEMSFDSGVREEKEDVSDREKANCSKPKTDITVDNENVEDVSLISAHSNFEKDSEYLEKYASLPTTLLKNISTDLEQSKVSEHNQTVVITNLVEKDITVESTETTHDTTDAAIFEGSYSRKEKEKWNNPISMSNNPYTEDNIRKRIQLNQIYGRDYYTKLASTPSGKTKTINEDNGNNFWSFNFQTSDEEENMYKAVPVITNDSEVEAMGSEEDPRNANSEVTSDSDISLINYYDVENSKIYHASLSGEGIMHTKVNSEVPINDFVDSMEKQTYTKTETEIVQDTTSIPAVAAQKEDEHIFEKRTEPEKNSTTTPQVIPRTFINKEKELPVPQKRSNFKENTSEKTKLTENTSGAFVNKKSDNTWIKKIYSNPVVRSFALSNREKLPYKIEESIIAFKVKSNNLVDETDKPIKSETLIEPKVMQTPKISHTYLDQVDAKSPVANNTFSLEFSDSDSLPTPPSPSNDYEVHELREQRLVASRLGEFSKSFPNLLKINQKANNENLRKVGNESDDSLPIESYVSVKDLKKIFEKKDNERFHRGKDEPAHSITARSIPKHIKEKLKNTNGDEYVNN